MQVKPWRSRMSRGGLSAIVTILILGVLVLRAGAELVGLAVEADQVGATDLRSAAAKASVDGLPIGERGGYPEDSQEIAGLEKNVALNREALALVRRAAQNREWDWGVKFPEGAAPIPTEFLSAAGTLVRVERAGALLAHAKGNDSDAVERIGDILFLSRSVRRPPMLVSAICWMGMRCNASELCVHMAPNLLIGQQWRGPQRGATPTQVKALIDELCDEAELEASALAAIRGERIIIASRALHFSFGKALRPETDAMGNAFRIWRSLSVLRSARLSLDFLAKMQSAIDHEDWQAASHRLQPFDDDSSLALLETMKRFYLCRADQRLAAAALAIRWYSIDHGGQLPRTLDDLVPAYLRSVAQDPFAAGKKPMRYLPDANQPIVYSVGLDGIDDGGSIERDPNVQFGGPRDYVVLLRRQPSGHQGPGVRWDDRMRRME